MKKINLIKNKNNLIQFVSTVPGLSLIKECAPQKTKNFIPDWFKNIPPSSFGLGTVKDCPSFVDWFSTGYVLPMWMDSEIFYDNESKKWETNSSPLMPLWDFHTENQMTEYVTPIFQGLNGTAIFKAQCPWRIITAPGWSVLQLPLFYNFNTDWSILPGIIDTDIHHEINQQVLYHGDKKSIFIKRGSPFVMYIPFKREKNILEVRDQNKKDIEKFNLNLLKIKSKIIGQGSYRKMQKERDRKN